MRTGRPKAELVLSEGERSQLQSFVRSRSLPAAQSTRARIILSSADGESNKVIAERLGITQATLGKWRSLFIERRIAGLYDDVRPGAPRTIDDERVAQLINTTLNGLWWRRSMECLPGVLCLSAIRCQIKAFVSCRSSRSPGIGGCRADTSLDLWSLQRKCVLAITIEGQAAKKQFAELCNTLLGHSLGFGGLKVLQPNP
jgi:transposase-like protein